MFEYEDMYGNLSTRNTMASSARLFGIVALFLCSNIALALPLGALAILFAILSRTEAVLTSKAKVGLICGCAALIATTVITVSSCYALLQDPKAMAELEQYLNYYLGYAGIQ